MLRNSSHEDRPLGTQQLTLGFSQALLLIVFQHRYLLCAIFPFQSPTLEKNKCQPVEQGCLSKFRSQFIFNIFQIFPQLLSFPFSIKLIQVMQQSRQPKQNSKLKQIRYRKLTLAGGNTIVTYNSVGKVQPKGLLIQFPVIDANNDQGQQLMDPKLYEEEFYKKNNYRAVKALMKVYQDGRKKNSAESMNVLGLDIKKINYEAPQNKQSLQKISKIPFTRSPTRHYSPLCKPKLTSRSAVRKNSQTAESLDKDLDERTVAMGGEQSLRLIKLQMTESTILYRKKKISRQVESVRKDQSRQSGQSPTSSPRRVKNKKQQYLYEKLAGQQKNFREEVNHIYEKRIKTYTDLLFKLQLSHSIYQALDLKPQELGNKGRRMKYFVGTGNNSAMIKGLLKRRYWWVPSDEKSQCCFVWTQIKVNGIFQKQKRGINQMAATVSTFPKKKIEEEKCNQELKMSMTLRKQSLSPGKGALNQRAKPLINQQFNYKLLNQDDEDIYRRYLMRYQQDNKEKTYNYKSQKCEKAVKEIQFEDSIVHNHLENNFYLGNKKALFYNLREYYSLMGENVFDVVPLTFHIKKGMKDPEYKRFIAYYNRRKNIIKKQQKIEEEEGYLDKRKTRNIWIVKPGENTNQGRGITVIDEIYELNNIIRRVGENKKAKKSNEADQEKFNSKEEEEQSGKRTYIVQMYIDRPMLYNSRKFDIRHYMLITNLYGVMRAYWYADGYIRTSSYEFDIDNFEPEIHLTNDAIQKKYADYGKYEPYNKISYEEFQRYLESAHPTKKYNFKEQILPKMRKMATDAAKSVYTKIAPKNQLNNFEIFGLDFMIDKNFRPWLIEINTNPCLDCSCPLMDRIIPYMVEQSFKLSLDVVYPPPNHYPNTCKHYAPMVNLQNFKYQLIFDSQSQGQQVRHLYRKVKGSLIEQIGQIEEDEQFKDDGKEIKLDDYT